MLDERKAFTHLSKVRTLLKRYRKEHNLDSIPSLLSFYSFYVGVEHSAEDSRRKRK